MGGLKTEAVSRGAASPCFDEDQMLLCSVCGGSYTHFEDLRIYLRGEDQDRGLRLDVDMVGAEVCATAKMGLGNPSARRSGVVLTFTCENCDGITSVTFAQHKGNTYIDQP